MEVGRTTIGEIVFSVADKESKNTEANEKCLLSFRLKLHVWYVHVQQAVGCAFRIQHRIDWPDGFGELKTMMKLFGYFT